MNKRLVFKTTFNETLPVVLVREELDKVKHCFYQVVDNCPLCGKPHKYLSDIFTFDRRECKSGSFITLKEDQAEYVTHKNDRFQNEETAK